LRLIAPALVIAVVTLCGAVLPAQRLTNNSNALADAIAESDRVRERAEPSGDVALASRLTASDFVRIGPGGVTGKRELIEGMARPGPPKLHESYRDLRVRVYGAVGATLARYRYSQENGLTYERQLTRVFHRDGDDWMLLASQFSVIEGGWPIGDADLPAIEMAPSDLRAADAAASIGMAPMDSNVMFTTSRGDVLSGLAAQEALIRDSSNSRGLLGAPRILIYGDAAVSTGVAFAAVDRYRYTRIWHAAHEEWALVLEHRTVMQ